MNKPVEPCAPKKMKAAPILAEKRVDSFLGSCHHRALDCGLCTDSLADRRYNYLTIGDKV